MYRTITASSQFKIYAAVALAALLMTLLAVTLTAGQAQATTTSTTIAPSGDDNPIPQQQGQAATPTPAPHKTPEACPGQTGNTNEKVAAVVDSGYYALFDVWWNDDEGELTNTVCPPEVEFVPAVRRGNRIITPARVDRSPSNINILAEPPTIIHIPRSARVDLSTSTTYTQTNYPDLWDADSKENRPNPKGTPVPGKGDRIVWALPACPDSPTTDGLCLSFSAALLNSADWKAESKIEYHLDHVHQIDIDKQDPRYTLAYDIPAGGATSALEAIWDSSDAKVAVMKVTPGEYDRPTWFFTDRGTYELQVHIRGEPNTTKDDPVSSDESVTSDVREYILHVGAEADLGVTTVVAPESTSPSSGDTVRSVTVTITASNSGPDTSEKTKVDVALPEGLTYSSHSTATGTYANGVWSIGELAVTNDDNTATNDDSPTLTITATVDAETHGKTLAASATISATETVAITEGTEDGGKEVVTYHVPVPDPTPGNNTASGTTTVARDANVNPMFVVIRTVAENSYGVNLGDPVPVLPGDGDTLKYKLTGVGESNFKATAVAGGAQLSVADSANLNYEDAHSYHLMLEVSDGKDADGNDDNWASDDAIPVRINITDVPNEQMSVTLSVDQTTRRLNSLGYLTARVISPLPTANLTFSVYAANHGVENRDVFEGLTAGHIRSITYDLFPVTRGYTYYVTYYNSAIGEESKIGSNEVLVEWTN